MLRRTGEGGNLSIYVQKTALYAATLAVLVAFYAPVAEARDRGKELVCKQLICEGTKYADRIVGNGKNNTIYGKRGADDLIDTADPQGDDIDYLDGGGGDRDYVNAADGDNADTLIGGGGEGDRCEGDPQDTFDPSCEKIIVS